MMPSEHFSKDTAIEDATELALPSLATLHALASSEAGFVALAHDIAAYCQHELAVAGDITRIVHSRHQLHSLERYITTLIANRQQKLEAQNALAEVRLRQERWIGAWLETHIAQGGNAKSHRETLQDIGVNKHASSRWQQIATLPTEEFETYIDTATVGGKELTTAGVLRLARVCQQATALHAREQHAQAAALHTRDRFSTDLDELVTTGQTFGCLYVDPPWAYDNQSTRASTHNHYATMTVDEICAFPVRQLAAPQSHLHLWTTNAFLFECPKIFEAWGFTFKSSFCWVKPIMGLGNYWRNSHELLLLGVRGGLTAQHHGLRSWVEAPRAEHSAKPERIRDLIEQISPGPYLELFGRSSVPGWTVWGNQCFPTDGRLFKDSSITALA